MLHSVNFSILICDRFEKNMTEFLTQIPESVLHKCGELELNIESQNCHKAIDDILARTVLSGGKRLRPMLTYLSARIFFSDIERLDPFAKAIEMVHAASLAHDDVVDNATKRRGEDSINIVSSNKRAVLAGDYLLADVIYTLAHKGDIKIVQEMSKVIEDLALGEWIQSDAIEKRNYSRELIEKIAQYKTASVMSWCTWIAAYLAGVGPSTQDSARELGRRIGLAFQLMDDTLDFNEDSQKDQLLDIQNGIVNSVTLEWLHLNPELLKSYQEGSELIDLWTEDNLSNIDQALKQVTTMAHEHMRVAKTCLNQMVESSELENALELSSPLNFLMDFILKRDF